MLPTRAISFCQRRKDSKFGLREKQKANRLSLDGSMVATPCCSYHIRAIPSRFWRVVARVLLFSKSVLSGASCASIAYVIPEPLYRGSSPTGATNTALHQKAAWPSSYLEDSSCVSRSSCRMVLILDLAGGVTCGYLRQDCRVADLRRFENAFQDLEDPDIVAGGSCCVA